MRAFFILLAIFVFGVIYLFVNYMTWWNNLPVLPVHARLISKQFTPARSRMMNGSMFVNGKMVITSYTTRDPERYITEWDLGAYGVAVSDEKELYTCGKQEALLEIKVCEKNVWIIGIKKGSNES